jgi:hypothetical protein
MAGSGNRPTTKATTGIWIRRGVCRPCELTFSILPHWSPPYGQYSFRCREQAWEATAHNGSGWEQAAPQIKDPHRLPDPATLRRWAWRRLLAARFLRYRRAYPRDVPPHSPRRLRTPPSRRHWQPHRQNHRSTPSSQPTPKNKQRLAVKRPYRRLHRIASPALHMASSARFDAPNVHYAVLERPSSVRATVPTPSPKRFAICLNERPRHRNCATCSRSNIFRGRWGGRFLPGRLRIVFPTLPLWKSCWYRR